MFAVTVFSQTQLPNGKIYQQDEAPPHFANIVLTFLDEQFLARWMESGSPYMACQITRSTPPDIFLWGFVQDQICRTQVRDLVDFKKDLMLLSKISHHRFFITHGSRLNIVWTFPVHYWKPCWGLWNIRQNKKTQFLLFVTIGFMYGFVLVQKLKLLYVFYWTGCINFYVQNTVFYINYYENFLFHYQFLILE